MRAAVVGAFVAVTMVAALAGAADAPKADAAKADVPKSEQPKAEAPKTGAPAAAAPKADAPATAKAEAAKPDLRAWISDRIVTAGGEALGTISDIVLEGGQPVALVVETNDELPRLILLPFQKVSRDATVEQVTIEIEREQVAQARAFRYGPGIITVTGDSGGD